MAENAENNCDISTPKSDTNTNNDKRKKNNENIDRLFREAYSDEEQKLIFQRLVILHYTGVYIPRQAGQAHDKCNGKKEKKRKLGNKRTKSENPPNKKQKTTFGQGRVGVSCESYGVKHCKCCPPINQNNFMDMIMKATNMNELNNNKQDLYIDLTRPSTSGFSNTNLIESRNHLTFSEDVINLVDSEIQPKTKTEIIEANTGDTENITEYIDLVGEVEMRKIEKEKKDSVIREIKSEPRNFANVESITDYIDLIAEDEMRKIENEQEESVNIDLIAEDEMRKNENEEEGSVITEIKSEPRNFADVESITDYIDLIAEEEMRKIENEQEESVNIDLVVEDEMIKNGNEEEEFVITEIKSEPRNFADVESITDYIDLIAEEEMRRIENEQEESVNVHLVVEDEMRKFKKRRTKSVNTEIITENRDDSNVESITDDIGLITDEMMLQRVLEESVHDTEIRNFANIENITDNIGLTTDEMMLQGVLEESARNSENHKLSATSLMEDTLNTEKEKLLSTDDLNKTSNSDSSTTGLSCPICFEPLKGREIMSTICGHLFCSECIKEVIKRTKSCPTCRKSLSLKRIHPIYIN